MKNPVPSLLVLFALLFLPQTVNAGEWRKTDDGYAYDDSVRIIKGENWVKIEISFRPSQHYGKLVEVRFADFGSDGEPERNPSGPKLMSYEYGFVSEEEYLSCGQFNSEPMIFESCNCYISADNFCENITEGSDLSITFEMLSNDWPRLVRAINGYDTLAIYAEESKAWVRLEGLRPLLSASSN